VGETVADEAKLALLDVLLDGVEELLLGDLMVKGEKTRQRCPKSSEKETAKKRRQRLEILSKPVPLKSHLQRIARSC
jgi:hypothetical protein